MKNPSFRHYIQTCCLQSPDKQLGLQFVEPTLMPVEWDALRLFDKTLPDCSMHHMNQLSFRNSFSGNIDLRLHAQKISFQDVTIDIQKIFENPFII
jgi:hypothetical protein